VLELHKTGLSQENISRLISNELGIKISRTTVGEIVRDEH
jgi:intein-encoded DNA endonuclease-like protein